MQLTQVEEIKKHTYFLKNELLKNVKDVIFYAYKNDKSFPRSCGLVSRVLTYLFGENNDLTSKCDINYVRGCFKNPIYETWCEDYHSDINRNNYANEKFANCNCHNCNACDSMIPHSWIEITNRKTREITILDFTSIQFEENFPDYQNDLLKPFTKEELYAYLEKRTDFLIRENNMKFNQYIPLTGIENFKDIIKNTNELKGTNTTNFIINYLEKCS